VKRRLRKKRRIGEFREDCFELRFHINPSLDTDGIDTVTDAFIEMIEASGLQFGGGGFAEWSGVVQGPFRSSATEEDRAAVLAWLANHPEIVDASAGTLRDAWHGWD
jgi:hypothetical protein